MAGHTVATGGVGDGLVVVDKPAGWTSHDVVARVRRLAGTRKVGHAGTLDPMATGVLVVGVNRATRLLTYLVGADKTYTATVRLGVATVTDDGEGEATEVADASAVTESVVRQAVSRLTGPIEQVPSAVSAIKVGGRRSYARVRAGEDVQLAARPVTVHRFDVLSTRPAVHDGTPVLDVDVEVDCSSGTYVRALARDLGAALGVGGHLTALRRTRVGAFDLSRASGLDALAEDLVVTDLTDAARALFPVRSLTQDEVVELGFGRRLPVDPPGSTRAVVAAVSPDDRLVALLEERAGAARPLVVFAPAGT